jgi:hypothetical protein
MSSLVFTSINVHIPPLLERRADLRRLRLGSIANPWYPRHLRGAASIVAMLIFFICIIASKARFASLPPTALTLLAAVGDDRVPVTVRLFLIVRRDLEGKGLGVPERRAAVETETGNTQDGELYVSTSSSLPPG